MFGRVKNGIMGLNELGVIVCEQWVKTEQLRSNVTLDEWIVMPNHVHGILVINHPPVETCRGTSLQVEHYNQFGPLKPNSLQSIINQFKGAVTRQCRKSGYSDFAWQFRFYDHIVRNEKDLNRIRKYIQGNPEKWEQDRNNPENLWY